MHIITPTTILMNTLMTTIIFIKFRLLLRKIFHMLRMSVFVFLFSAYYEIICLKIMCIFCFIIMPIMIVYYYYNFNFAYYYAYYDDKMKNITPITMHFLMHIMIICLLLLLLA